MATASLQHRRTHNLLLVSKLLNQRETASPFTLVLDDVEQSGKPLLGEFIRRAQTAKVKVIFVAFESLQAPRDVVFIPAWREETWQQQVASNVNTDTSQRKLLILDALNHLATTEAANLPTLLFSLMNPNTSLLAGYHTDVPESFPQVTTDAYSPSPLTLLKYLATTIFTTHSFHHVLARKAARERSHEEPSFGLEEGIEGIIHGLGANGKDGLVLEMEHRRKSGRGVREWYFLPRRPPTHSGEAATQGRLKETITLLEDHPLYRPEVESGVDVSASDEASSTFDLGLTEKQRHDRDGVVLPYFDAQRGEVEGGRILYDMGIEDDFDEEEDEI